MDYVRWHGGPEQELLLELGRGGDSIAESNAYALDGENGPSRETYENGLEEFACLDDFAACGVGVHELEISLSSPRQRRIPCFFSSDELRMSNGDKVQR